MDVPRKSAARNRKIRRIITAVLAVIAIAVITKVVMGLKPAAPRVELAQLWPDTVKRGPMLRQVRGMGTLVPETPWTIPAMTDGRIEQRLALPGTVVSPDTLLLVMSNPELQQALVDAEWKLKAAEAELNNLRVKLQSDRLTQQAAEATVETDAHKAKMTADRDSELRRLGLKSDLEAKISIATAEDLASRDRIEKERLKIGLEAIDAQMAVQKATVEQLRAMYELKQGQVRALQVRAGVHGILTQVAVDIGQRVTAGTLMAKVVQPEHLKAELKIPETQVKDVRIGQFASVDTRNGIIDGKVARIDPAAVNGTVTVDVKLEGKLPEDARPDLSVDGTVELEKLTDVVYVGRPTFGQPNSTISLFKIDPDGRGANRVQVKLGRSSVNTIEILGGLQVGDRVILSDMTTWDAHDRIRLN